MLRIESSIESFIAANIEKCRSNPEHGFPLQTNFTRDKTFKDAVKNKFLFALENYRYSSRSSPSSGISSEEEVEKAESQISEIQDVGLSINNSVYSAR